MGWNYSGRPDSNERDKVRFLIGDTCKENPLVQDEEIQFALGKFPMVELAAALCCRAIAAKFSRQVSTTVGSVSRSCSDLAKAYAARAKELDPDDSTTGGAATLVLPSFGGISLTEKEKLDSDLDATPVNFKIGADDIPGGPDSVGRSFGEGD